MLESARQKKIINHLHSLGAWTVKVIQGNKSGVPDIVACVPMTKDQVLKHFETNNTIGVFVGVEVKQPNGITSNIQKRTIRQIKGVGGIAASDITSVEDLKELLNH